MNTDDKHIEQMTKALMQGSAEKLPSSLMSNILMRVARENREVKRIKIEANHTMKWIVTGLLVYLAIAVVMLPGLYSDPEIGKNVAVFLKQGFPLIITVCGSISMFFFFAQLDKLLRQQGKI